jgi:hypothetical protein
MGIKQQPGMGFVGLVPDEEPFMRIDDLASITHSYPTADGTILFHTFRFGKTLHEATQRPAHFFLLASTTKNDPRLLEFETSDDDSTIGIPMTEASVYGLMQLLTTMRADMNPESAGMLSALLETGLFAKH